MFGNVGVIEWLSTLVIIFAGYWYYLMSNYDYWKKRGVPGPEPSIVFGNLKNILLSKCCFKEGLEEICKDFQDEPMVGCYTFRSPMLLLRDPELIKDVLIKDFSIFADRGVTLHEDMEPLHSSLFTLEPKRWRILRSKMSPAFTSGKLKHMFTMMLECADYFEKYLDSQVEKNEIIDCREIAAKFTTDVIGNCAFGIQMNALAREDSEFREMGKRALTSTFKVRMLELLRTMFPWLYVLLGIPVMPPEVTEFFMSSIKQTIDYRKKNNVRRGDIVDILMDLKDGPQTPDLVLTDGLLASQAFVFFIAGFETSSTTISHALLELSQRQDLQDRLRKEIIDSLKESDGIISYEGIKKMEYLDMVFRETLRLRPPLPVHFRKAAADYTFRGTNVTVSKGQGVVIPVSEIHENPKYYPNPQVFDPERFTEDMIKSRHPLTFLSFGDGPRNCIGARFAIYQTKLGLIKILAKYKVELTDKVQLPYRAEPTSFLLHPVGGIHLKFSRIHESQ